MSTIVEELLPPIRLFFTGLLAMSYQAGNNNVTVGIQHGVADHHLRITAFERPVQSHGWGESRALYTGMPVHLYNSRSAGTGHWRLQAEGGVKPVSTGDILHTAVVLDGEGYHNMPLSDWLREGAFPWRFSFSTGDMYSATMHFRLIKTVPPGGAVTSKYNTPIQAGSNFGVNIYPDPSKPASLVDENNRGIFQFTARCRYDVYVNCLPDYEAPGSKAEAFGPEQSDFQFHYDSFTLPSDEWYDVSPEAPSQHPEDEDRDPGVNFVNPCVPVLLSQTPI
jgi:hypothetical protein